MLMSPPTPQPRRWELPMVDTDSAASPLQGLKNFGKFPHKCLELLFGMATFVENAMAMGRCVAILLLMAVAAAGHAQGRATAWLVETGAVVPRDGQRVWDFSSGGVSDNEAEVTLTAVNDSVLKVSMPSKRFEFVRRGDDVWRLKCENHFMEICDTVPVLEWSAAPRSRSGAIGQRGVAFQERYLVSDGYWTLSEPVKGRFITTGGDTIDDVTLRCRLTSQTSGRSRKPCVTTSGCRPGDRVIQTRRVWLWTHPGFTFPLARTELAVDSAGGRESARKLMTWVSVSHDGAAARARSRGASSDTPGYDIQGDLISNDLSVTIDGGMLRVSAGDAGAGGEILLCDMLGRVRSTGRGAMETDLSALPPGDYLLSVRVGDTVTTRKIPVH